MFLAAQLFCDFCVRESELNIVSTASQKLSSPLALSRVFPELIERPMNRPEKLARARLPRTKFFLESRAGEGVEPWQDRITRILISQV